MISTGVWIDDIDAQYHAVLGKLSLLGLTIMAVVASIALAIDRDIAEASRGDEIGDAGPPGAAVLSGRRRAISRGDSDGYRRVRLSISSRTLRASQSAVVQGSIS